MRKYIVLFFAGICSAAIVHAQVLLPYKNRDLPVEERVRDLLSRMTKEEKFWQLFMIPGDVPKNEEAKYDHGIFGLQVTTASTNTSATEQFVPGHHSEQTIALAKKTNAIQRYFIERSRLGIPVIFFDEALHGLVRNGATIFPQAIGLAATWDTALVHQVADQIANEARSRGIRQVLSPVINIASDVRWGRVEETYGEDPFLSSEMGVAYITAFEQQHIITTPKHFVANVGDGGRDSYPISLSERALDRIYFLPFKAAVERAGARSIMTSYNSLNGIPCSANDWLLNKKLKGDWHFKGFVISDAGGVGGANVLHLTAPDYPTAGAQAITGGLDVIFQTSYDHYKLFIPPFLNGAIDSTRINDAVARVLRAKFELGLFDDPYVNESPNADAGQENKSKHLANETASESFVLLKNEGSVLPLASATKSIAVIGSDAVEARPGGYSGTTAKMISILEGIKKRAGKNISVRYSRGSVRIDSSLVTVPVANLSAMVDGKIIKGLRAEYFNNIDLKGIPALTRTDEAIDFHWTLSSPGENITDDFFSARWTGKLHPSRSSNVSIGLEGNDGYRLFIDNVCVIDRWMKQSYNTVTKSVFLSKDKSYDIRVEFFEPVGNGRIRLVWNFDRPDDNNKKIKDAVALAKNSNVAVVVAGIEEGEFRDRSSLKLPGNQEMLIEKIAATGTPVVVLLVGGSAITMQEWKDKVAGIADIWYPGEDGGNAVASVLFGDISPSGRLPITFPKTEGQLPLVYDHEPTGRGDDYNDLSGLPLFPFGFGLTYTHFNYSDLRLSKTSMHADDTSAVTFKITNAGTRAGTEVVQLYSRNMGGRETNPVMELKGFQRVKLAAGETKEITFVISRKLLTTLSSEDEGKNDFDHFKIMIGASAADIRLKRTIDIK